MDYTTATKAIDTMGAMVAKQKPFFTGSNRYGGFRGLT